VAVPAFSERNSQVAGDSVDFYTVTDHVTLTFEQLQRHFPDMEIAEDAKCRDVLDKEFVNILQDPEMPGNGNQAWPGHVIYNFNPFSLND
jgi:hypothetical protein